jgi:predicted transcriptional regulator
MTDQADSSDDKSVPNDLQPGSTTGGFPIQTEIDVLETLADRSPCHVMEIATAVDGHPITVDQACTHLHNAECIRPLGRGLYEITAEGERRLETQHRP